MKKLLLFSLILVFAITSVSFAAVSKTKTTTVRSAAPASSGISIAPKLALATGDYSGVAIGVESYFFSPVPGFDIGADGYYKLASNNVSWMQIGGICRYMIPMEGQAFRPYVGGGLNYNMYSLNIPMATSSSASGIGFKIFGGADIPVAGVGIFYGNAGYGINNFTYTIPGIVIGGQTFGGGTISATGGGIYLEGGYRFVL